MSRILSTTVKINDDLITDKIESVLNDPSLMTEVHQEFADLINPWVPYDTGNLSQDITVSPDGVTYNAEYAAKQYFGTEFRHKTNHHPLATAYWDKVAMQTEKEVLASRVNDIIRRRLSNG